MSIIGTITQDAEGVVQWKIEGFTSLKVDSLIGDISPCFSFAEGVWYLWIRRVSPGRGRSGGINLGLARFSGGPPTLDVAYALSIQERHGYRHGGQTNRMVFRQYHASSKIPIELEEEKMSEWLPNNMLTVLCHMERIHPTQGADVSTTSNCSYCGGAFDARSISSHQGKCLDKPIQCPECSDVVLLRNWHECHSRSAQEAPKLRKELEQMTAMLESVNIRFQRLYEELNLKMIDIEANRENVQKSLETGSEDCDSKSSSLLQKNKVLRDLKDLFLKREDCDVVLRVQGQEFPAHRTILMARSPVLASTFRSDMKEKVTGVVEIEDCDPSSFGDFLCYLYCGALENLSPANAFDLFTTADKYDIRDLRSECLEFMKGNLSVDTFCDTITLALRHSETELLHVATDFFIHNAPQIIVTVKWQQFLIDNPMQSNELLIKLLVPNKK